MRKLGLVAGVGVAWLVTFIVMGGNGLPSIDFSAEPSSTVSPGPQAGPNGPAETATPIGPNSNPTATATSQAGSAALKAEALASVAPLGGATLAARPKPRRMPPPVADFRMASFNVLGSSHTRGKTKRPQKRSGVARMAQGTRYVVDNKISLVGFQELQPDQRRTFLNGTGGRYGLYPGGSSLDGDNSIAWRKDTWDLVKAQGIAIPYFGGHTRDMPLLLLRHKASGITIYIHNVHNPADTKEYGRQGRWRAAATAREASLLRDLKDDGYPVFMTGDMNEKQSWFCSVAGPGDMRAAAGGEGARNGCSVAGGYRIDWVIGSHDVQWTGYTEDKSGAVKSMTDHPIIIADVRINSRDFPKSVTRP
ncbi:hypothetical protein ABIE44_001945 [Marmoricola sp. OAE513]|uniref:endonuclease/exonuclease/phosphatase family protein n=1 Tax=Marmoricola sp. OAE513 TaxID=2817894 RepID=UPI001AE9ED7D